MPDSCAAARDGTREEALGKEILSRLRAPQPTLPCTLFYDERGSKLYEQITALTEYYPFAAEVEILTRRGAEIARTVGEGALVVEYGSGSSVKTRLLLDALPACAGYVPIDISGEHLLAAARDIAKRYPGLWVEPLCADFTGPVTLPAALAGVRRRLAFFPGSTIGNFELEEATALLRRIRDTAGDEGRLLIGVDVPKARAVLELAYDDPRGVTAQFNLNILNHVNRLLDGDFDPELFQHEAVWNEQESRVEMHLRCTRDHTVTLAGERVSFARGQSIWTESSYKFPPEVFIEMCRQAGFRSEAVWFDGQQRYSLHLLAAA